MPVRCADESYAQLLREKTRKPVAVPVKLPLVTSGQPLDQDAAFGLDLILTIMSSTRPLTTVL